VPRDHTLRIPAQLRDSVAGTDDGERWLSALPDLVSTCEQRWHVRVGNPFEGGSASWCAPATRADGTDAVVKVSFPHREARAEGTGLRLWNGDGAVLLFDEDRDQYALLIERCRPGTRLRDTDLPVAEALTIGAELLSRMWREPPDASGYELVADVAAEWAVSVREKMERLRPPVDAGLVELGASLLESLPASATRAVVVHGDFNPGNVLAATREPWLAIDCKPMVGDPGYDPSQFLLQVDPPFECPDPETVLTQRFELFATLVDEDPRRLFAWAVAREVENIMWATSAEHPERVRSAMDQVAVLARLAEL
jgi:streptomycin 6-kinase